MADLGDRAQAATGRGTGPGLARKSPAPAQERGTSQRGVAPEVGNAGTFVGTESRQGFLYARYRAEKGTWISASLAQLGYDKLYGKETGYGAYLGLAKAPDGKPLTTPDKIQPGQHYLIPVGTAVDFAVPPQSTRDPPVQGPPRTSLLRPQTALDTKPWAEEWYGRRFKDLLLRMANMPNYPSFELQGPPPPSKVPRDAVAFWLTLHKDEIITAERRWRISRLAIAGAIAWEALEDPAALSVTGKAFGPGKMHVWARGELTWPDALELSGRVRPLTVQQRQIELAKPDVAITYIGATLDLAAEVAEKSGWNIRNNPEILGQIYHSWPPVKWIQWMKTKPANQSFKLSPGSMGKWIDENRTYLGKAVGQPGEW